MLGSYNPYTEDETIIKQLGNKLEVINLSCCRKKGFELDTPTKKTKRNSVNSEKLANNISRSKSKVRELALCNEWGYFCTLTIDSEKYDRYDLEAYRRDLAEFLHGFNRRRPAEKKIKYLLIAEMHKDGAWHMHGLLQGLQKEDLYKNSNKYLGWKSYEKRFGYISLSPVKDADKVANYITKYITKDMAQNITELGYHLYYCSQGLKTAIVLYRGKAKLVNCDWDFKHPDGYCKKKTFDIRTDDYTDFIRLE